MRTAPGAIIEAIRNNLLDDPNVRGIVVNTRDVTKRKEMENKLRKSEESLAEAQSIAHLGNWEWDVQTSEILWSTRFSESTATNRRSS